ncbi:MAG: HAD hydrolase family protein [Thermoanaerobaculia bacterium]
MRFQVLALDYDGTITADGMVDPHVREAIGKARSRGITVVIVTGRRITHLRSDAGDLNFVDGIVAENGALILIPRTGEATLLAPAPLEGFAAELNRRGIPHVRGEVVIEFDAAVAADVLKVVRELQLPLVLAFNRGRLMALPQGVSKATGLWRLLATMRKSLHNTVAIGDAENDHELLRAAELGAAVQWGSPALIAAADDVVNGDGPEAVASYIDMLLESDRIPPARLGRRKLLLGTRSDDGTPVRLDIKGRNMLIVGDPRSGKSWVTGLLAEQLVMQRYCVCVIDPEGDYEGLEILPDVIVFGGDDPPPRARELTRALRHADVSIVVNLSKLPLDEKRLYVRELLEMLIVLRRRTGLPHRIVLDEAHYFLAEPLEKLIDLDLAGYTLVSYRASQLPATIVDASETLIVTRETDRSEVAKLFESHRLSGSIEEWTALLSSLRVDEAMLLWGADETEQTPARVRLPARRTYHVRHLQKYIDVPVAAYHAFVFTRAGKATGLKALTLQQLSQVLAGVDTEAIDSHLRRGDFSRWIADVYGDRVLAAQIAECEERYRLKSIIDVNDAMNAAIRSRYEDAEPNNA